MPRPAWIWKDNIARTLGESKDGEWNFKPEVFACLEKAGIGHQEAGVHDEKLVIDGESVEYFFKEEGGTVTVELHTDEARLKKLLNAAFSCYIERISSGGRKTRAKKQPKRKTRKSIRRH